MTYKNCPNFIATVVLEYQEFLFCQAKAEILGEAFEVATDGFVEVSCCNAVECCQIAVEHHLPATHLVYECLYALRRWHYVGSIGHHGQSFRVSGFQVSEFQVSGFKLSVAEKAAFIIHCSLFIIHFSCGLFSRFPQRGKAFGLCHSHRLLSLFYNL